MKQGNKLPPSKSRLTGLTSEQPEFVARNTATQNPNHLRKEAKIPFVKVLAVKGLHSRSPLQGLGQSPKVFHPKVFL